MTDTFLARPRAVEAAFATVFPHVGTDRTLPMLTTIRVELAGSTLLLAATDRYTMGAYRADLDEWAGEDFEQDALDPVAVNLYATDLRRLFAFARSEKKAPARWTVTPERLAVELGDGSKLSIRTVEVGGFVDFRKVYAQIGKQPADVAHVLNVGPPMIARFVDSAKAIDRYSVVNFWPGALRTTGIAVTIGDRFAGLLMPVRVEGEQTLDLPPRVAAPSAAAPAELPAGSEQ